MNSQYENRDDGESGSSNYPARMLIPPHTRRSTIMFGNVEQGEEPQENPNNSPEVNEMLKREYHSIKELNATFEHVNESVESLADMIKEYRNTVNQTETLLKLWKDILVRAEGTKATIEAHVAPSPVFKKPEPVKRKPSGFGSGIKRRRIRPS